MTFSGPKVCAGVRFCLCPVTEPWFLSVETNPTEACVPGRGGGKGRLRVVQSNHLAVHLMCFVDGTVHTEADWLHKRSVDIMSRIFTETTLNTRPCNIMTGRENMGIITTQ